MIRQISQNCSTEQLEATLEVLENACEARGISEEELNVIGELITNVCGALEVQSLVSEGKTVSEALNTFSKKVIGSIDR